MVIYSQNFAAGNQQYLTLSAESYARPLTIGTDWNRLRIGILAAIPSLYGNAWNIKNATIAAGVCAGIASSPTANAPAHCVGYGLPIPPQTATGCTWSYNAGSSGYTYYSNSTTKYGFKYAAGANTLTSGLTLASMLPRDDGTLPRRGLLIFDFAKSALISGNMSISGLSGAAAHMSLDITSNDLYYALGAVTAPVVQGTALTQGSGATVAFNETTNGALNTVFVFWSNWLPFQLYEIGVFRLG